MTVFVLIKILKTVLFKIIADMLKYKTMNRGFKDEEISFNQ